MKKLYTLLIALFVFDGAMAQWAPQNSGTTNHLNSVFFTDANTGWAVGANGIILKTTNGGSNWVSQNSGISNDLTSIFFNDPNNGYAVGDSGRILKTTNGGTLWSNQTSGIINDLNSVYFIGADTGYAVSSGVLIGTVLTYHILKTTNGGALWTIIYSNGDTTLGTGGVTSNGLKSIYFTDNDNGYVVGHVTFWEGESNPIILKTINGGADWTSQSAQVGKLNSVYFINADTGFAVGGRLLGSVIKTSDGGTDWSAFTFGFLWTFQCYLNSVFFTDAYYGYAVGRVTSYQMGLIIKTTNGGTEWAQLLSGTSYELNSVYFPSTDTGYIVGKNGIILKTTNGGGYPVGINNHTSYTNNLKISPNPVSTNIIIESTTKGHLSILNLNGQEIITRQITEPKTNLDISTLPGGVYFVRLTGERMVEVGKIIKW